MSSEAWRRKGNRLNSMEIVRSQVHLSIRCGYVEEAKGTEFATGRADPC
jgi:hypothetical protein